MMMVLVVFSGVPVCMYHNNNKLLLLITYLMMVLVVFSGVPGCVLIIIMYIYHALINALITHMIHINLNMIFYTHIEHSPTKTIYIKYYNFFFF